EGGPVTGQPAESNGVVTTGSTDPDGGDSAGNPWGPEIGLLAPGGGIRTIDPTFSYYGMARGSSNSAMVTAGVVALAMSAHPEATSNQILQAVVRTTDGSLHEPARDEDRGFGALDVRQLMAVDPTTLPDVNPFIRTDAEARPSAEELGLVAEDAPTEAATAPASADEPAEDPAPEDGPDLLVTGAAVVGAALLVAAATATVLVLRRRRTATPTDPTDQQHGGQHHG
ncbi:S8 family serine peptidase, partial [Cellulomonas hominis]